MKETASDASAHLSRGKLSPTSAILGAIATRMNRLKLPSTALLRTRRPRTQNQQHALLVILSHLFFFSSIERQKSMNRHITPTHSLVCEWPIDERKSPPFNNFILEGQPTKTKLKRPSKRNKAPQPKDWFFLFFRTRKKVFLFFCFVLLSHLNSS